MSRPRITRTHIHTAESKPLEAAAAQASLQLLRLLHLASPALPIGAFHFSQGLEHAVETGWATDEGSALEWIGGIAAASLGTLDLPVLLRLLGAWKQDDHEAVFIFK
jgi:urease accessory protein